MLSRVGDEHMGRFLLETLSAEGCDVSQVKVDPERLTALVLLGIKDRDTFPLLFYRENCADMALEEADINEDFIASSKALLITGTHFSTAKVNAASRKAWRWRGSMMCAPCWISTIARCCGALPARAMARSAISPATG
jgi:5-dehydro-2-deoxygluconokinase